MQELGTTQTAKAVQGGFVAERFPMQICRTADVLSGDPQKDSLLAQPDSYGFNPGSMVSTESPLLVRSVSSLTSSRLDVQSVECD